MSLVKWFCTYYKMILQFIVKLKFEPKLADKFGQLCHLLYKKNKFINLYIYSPTYLTNVSLKLLP